MVCFYFIFANFIVFSCRKVFFILIIILIYREKFGYISANWRDPPSQDPKYVRKRAMQIQISLQCGEYIYLHNRLAKCPFVFFSLTLSSFPPFSKLNIYMQIFKQFCSHFFGRIFAPFLHPFNIFKRPSKFEKSIIIKRHKSI